MNDIYLFLQDSKTDRPQTPPGGYQNFPGGSPEPHGMFNFLGNL